MYWAGEAGGESTHGGADVTSDPMETAIYEPATAREPSGPAAEEIAGGASETGPRVLVIEEGVPGPEEAFAALRQGRLRAAAAFLTALTSLFAALFLAGGNVVGWFH